MKRIIYVLTAAAILSCISCSKSAKTSATPTSNVSTFNITFKGKTFHIADNTNGGSVIVFGGNGGGLVSDIGNIQVVAKNGTIEVGLNGNKPDAFHGTGTYQCYSTAWNYIIMDGIQYDADLTSSSITISVSSDKEVKGTFTLLLTDNGINYSATGDFDDKY